MMAMTIFMGLTPAWARSLRVQVAGNLRCVLDARSLGSARQSHWRESSGVPVRCVSRKCAKTKGVCRPCEEVLRPFGKRRTNPAQGCTIFNQENPETWNAHVSGAPGAPEGSRSGLEFETAVFF